MDENVIKRSLIAEMSKLNIEKDNISIDIDSKRRRLREIERDITEIEIYLSSMKFRNEPNLAGTIPQSAFSRKFNPSWPWWEKAYFVLSNTKALMTGSEIYSNIKKHDILLIGLDAESERLRQNALYGALQAKSQEEDKLILRYKLGNTFIYGLGELFDSNGVPLKKYINSSRIFNLKD